MTNVAEAFVTLRPDLKGFGDEVGRSLQSLGPKFQQAGTFLTAGLSVPIVGLGALASKASIDFESAFAGVAKTVDATDAQLAVLRKGIREMAKELPASAGEIAKVAESAGQLGIARGDILSFTEVMVKLGATTNLTADEAAVAFAKITNIMQIPTAEVGKLSAVLVDLGNKGASTERDIVEMATRIAGAGKQVGLSGTDVLAFANALSSIGIETEAGGSSISRVLAELGKAAISGGEDLDKFAAVAGQSSADFAKAFKQDAATATITFMEGLRRISDEGGNVFQVLDDLGLADIRLSRALLGAAGAGDLFRESLENGRKAALVGTAADIEFAKRAETTAAKMEVLRNKLNDVAITLGDALVPVLVNAVDAAEPLLKVITVMAEGFAKLPAPVQTGIVAILALLAVIGPMLLVIGGMITGFGAIVTIAPLVGAAFTLMLGPVGLIILALAALGVGIFLAIKHWDAIKAAVTSAANAIKDAVVSAFNTVLDFIKVHWKEIAVLISGPFAPLVILATDGFGIRTALINAFTDVVKWFGGLPAKILGAMGDLRSLLVDAGEKIMLGLLDGMKDGAESVYDWVKGVGKSIADLKGPLQVDMVLLEPAGNALMQGLSNGLQQGYTAKVAPTIESITQRLRANFSAILNDFDLEKLGLYRGWREGSPGAKAAAMGTGPSGPLGGYWQNGVWVPLKIQPVPRLVGGMDFVPADRFPALLDRGERVLTAQENQAYSQGATPMKSDLIIQTLGPLNINNYDNKQDVDKALSDLMYAAATQARYRGVRR